MLHPHTSNLTEQSLYPWIPFKKAWRLGAALPQRQLVAMQLLDAKACARRKGFVDMGWALLAATDSGQVIVLCPVEDELRPAACRHRMWMKLRSDK